MMSSGMAMHDGSYAMSMGHHALPGPLIGNIIVVTLASVVTLACFVIALHMLIRPGEEDRNHPKYRVLKPDR